MSRSQATGSDQWAVPSDVSQRSRSYLNSIGDGLVRPEPDAVAGVQADGTCWCGATVWQGHTAMRVSVIAWGTTESDIDRSVAAISRIAQESPGEN